MKKYRIYHSLTERHQWRVCLEKSRSCWCGNSWLSNLTVQ